VNSSVALVVGTRPEIVKLAMVARELGRAGVLIHTGQHYDPEMSAQFFEEFGIGEPGVVIEGVGARSRTGQIATAMQALADEFASGRYGAVIVQGDTNTVSAAAQAANYAGVPLIHVEAGLRSHDRAMPEEINRLVAGALADVHCAATSVNAANLRAEGVERERILLTGNPIVEATLHSLQQGTPTLPAEAGLVSSGVVATIHRPENTDTRESLTRVLKGLAGIDAPSSSSPIRALGPPSSASISVTLQAECTSSNRSRTASCWR
jgi:UDP-N-acetylglucosamine 2-epimerase (non-hydrolysing)